MLANGLTSAQTPVVYVLNLELEAFSFTLETFSLT